ncbi:MAG: DUF2332 domain-containing protein [Actinobacteria bacterium]|nr:DUF2332 domain-containing protein [Actinomycetota bacterium]
MSRWRPDQPGVGALLETIENQRLGCELAGSPLYADLLDAVADDVVADGPCAGLLAPLAGARYGDAVLLRLLAAVHELVLEGEAPELAAHYPSAGGSPGPAAGRAFVAEVARHRDRIAGQLGRGVQTNEVGRSVPLLTGYLALAPAGLPLRILEVGASAGLNLRFDRYRYEAGGAGFGPPDSPLRFVDPWAGRVPPLDRRIEVATREGCDLDPIDPTTDAGRLRLRSYLWPDQPQRRARLDAALAVAAQVAAPVERADAASWLAHRLREPAVGCVTVVVHSIVLQYLSVEDRSAVLGLLDDAGARATPEAPLVWLRMEPGGDQAETRVTLWPGGTTHLVARSSYHGPPVALVDAGPVPW